MDIDTMKRQEDISQFLHEVLSVGWQHLLAWGKSVEDQGSEEKLSLGYLDT